MGTCTIFRIKNNGWISKRCSMSRGISQGCPFNIFSIVGVNVNMSSEIKYIQNADYFTLAVENIQH